RDRAGPDGVRVGTVAEANRPEEGSPKEGSPKAGSTEEGTHIMSMNFELMEALQVIEREKGVSMDTLLDALANALVSAYKRMPNAAEEAVVTIDPDSGEMHVYAQELDEDGNVVREWEDTPEDFGRIAAQ